MDIWLIYRAGAVAISGCTAEVYNIIRGLASDGNPVKSS